jgi:hypothetical protein
MPPRACRRLRGSGTGACARVCMLARPVRRRRRVPLLSIPELPPLAWLAPRPARHAHGTAPRKSGPPVSAAWSSSAATTPCRSATPAARLLRSLCGGAGCVRGQCICAESEPVHAAAGR